MLVGQVLANLQQLYKDINVSSTSTIISSSQPSTYYTTILIALTQLLLHHNAFHFSHRYLDSLDWLRSSRFRSRHFCISKYAIISSFAPVFVSNLNLVGIGEIVPDTGGDIYNTDAVAVSYPGGCLDNVQQFEVYSDPKVLKISLY